jgi:hypothetical protein
MVLFASVVFAGDVNGVRGSEWGSSPLTIRDNENALGGEMIMRGFNDEALFELQFEIPMKMGPAMSYYVFDDNDKLINGGVVILMKNTDINDFNIYYRNYLAIKDFLKGYLNSKPVFNTCNEIQVIDNSIVQSCERQKDWMGELIAFKKVELQNEFLSPNVHTSIKIHGNSDYGATLQVHYTPTY